MYMAERKVRHFCYFCQQTNCKRQGCVESDEEKACLCSTCKSMERCLQTDEQLDSCLEAKLFIRRQASYGRAERKNNP